MTTTPTRINRIWPTLNSILGQSQLPEKIYLWLPEEYKRFEGVIKTLPAFLANHPLIEVAFVKTDYGPATKLLPALNRFKNTHKKIVVMDDDRLYHRRVIERLINYSLQYPGSAITYIGSDVCNGRRIKYTCAKAVKTVDVLHGYGSYLVTPEFFNDHIFHAPENLPSAFFQDDVWISGCLKLADIEIKMIPHAFIEAHQNLFLQNWLGGKKALCRNENRTVQNFLTTWAYFQEHIKFLSKDTSEELRKKPIQG